MSHLTCMDVIFGRRRVLAKIGARDRIQAVIYAYD